MKRRGILSLRSRWGSLSERLREVPTLRNVIWYSSSNLFGQLLGVLTAFIRPTLLGPEQFGLFSLLRVIPTYALYLDLGTLSSMRYQIAYHRGRGDHAEVGRITGTVFLGSLALNLIAAALVIILAFYPELSVEQRFGLMASAGTIVVGWYFHHYYNRLKGEQDFKLVSLINYFDSFVTVALSVLLIYLFGIYGAFLSIICAGLLTIVFMHKRGVIVRESGFELTRFKSLVKTGLPITTFSLAPTVLRTGDRFVISYLLGAEALGFYAISAMILGFLLNIPGASREVIELELMQDLDKSERELQFKRYFWNPIVKLAFLMPLLIVPAYVLLPLVVEYVLPRYEPGIVPTQILIVATFFIAISYPIRGTIVSNRWQWPATLATTPSILLNIGLCYLLIRQGWGIAGAALGTGISFLAMAASLIAFVLLRIRNRLEALELHHLVLVLAPWLFTVVYLYSMGGWQGIVPPFPLLLPVIRLAAFGLAYLGFCLLAIRAGWLKI